MNNILKAFVFLCLPMVGLAQETESHVQKVVRYDLYVKDTIVNFTGRERHAIAINGRIPGPTLTFTEGGVAEIHVHNLLAGFRYIITKNIAPSVHYDSDMGFGAGVTISY